MIFLRAYSHVLVQKSGAIQNPADIDAVDESGVRLSNEVGKLLVGASLVNGGIQNHLGRRVEHPTADAVMPLGVLEQGEVGHVLVCNTQHDIGGIAVAEDVVVCCAESCEILGEPPRPYGRGFRAFRRDGCFRRGCMTSYGVTPRFRGLLHAHVVLPVGRLAWPGDI